MSLFANVIGSISLFAPLVYEVAVSANPINWN